MLPGCFPYLPLRVVIATDETGDAQLTIDHPADLFAAYGDSALDAVADDFCRSFLSWCLI